jgi:Na+/H+-dicarboxylate symporter
MVAGLLAGLVVNGLAAPLQALGEASPLAQGFMAFLAQANAFLGDLFLRALRFIAVPIVLFSLVVGASSLNDLRKLSRMGSRTVLIYISTTAIAITVGLLLANLARPGRWLPAALRDRLAMQAPEGVAEKIQSATAPNGWATLLDLVPTNPFRALAEGNMLQVVVTALAVGVALTLVSPERARPVIHAAEGLTDAVIKLVELVMKLAPVAVFCLIARVVAGLGLEVLGALLVYSLTVVAGLLTMTLGVYAVLLRTLAGVGPRRFFGAMAPAMLLAFSSSSSAATLPVTLECAKKRLGVSEEVSSFVIPLGATINMDGTALYQGVAALFIAQLYGLELGFSAQLTIVLTATLASIGTAAVPGVGLIMLVVVLQSVGMTPDVMAGGIAIIFGVDRLLDMCRTVTNVTGDAMVAAVIASREGALSSDAEVRARAQGAVHHARS